MTEGPGMSPGRDGEVFDSIEFDGVESPGTVVLSGHVREEAIDVKQADGQKGATTTWKGQNAGSFVATFHLVYDPVQGIDDFVDWDEFALRLRSTVPPISGDKPVAKDIWHPDLERNGYNAVILQKMGEMVHDGKGGATIAVTLSEYFPPKPVKTGGPKKSKTKEDPNDPLVQATKELKSLSQEAFGP